MTEIKKHNYPKNRKRPARKEVTRDKIFKFRCTNEERLHIHTLLNAYKTTLIELIYIAYADDFARIVVDPNVPLQNRQRRNKEERID
jgi:hypothetical protein